MTKPNSDSYYKVEKYFFYFIVSLNLFPLLSNPYWVTMDGAAHVYNATILKNMLCGDGWFHSFYEINKEFVPNWFGHVVLVGLKLFFSGAVSDKIFLLSYGVLFPFSFRYLIKQIAPKNILLTYLILPFTYTFVFTMGFYNFCFSLVFLFLILGYFIRYHNSLTWKRKIILSTLLLLCYFSHLFSFLSAVLILPLFLLFNFHKPDFSFVKHLKICIKRCFVLCYCSATPLFLTVLYFYNRRHLPKNEVLIPTFDLTKELYDFRAIFSYTTVEEGIYNKIYLVVFFVFFMSTLYFAIKKILLKQKAPKYYFRPPCSVWILLALLFAILYYTMPDSDGYAGYISVRLAIMIYIFLIIFFATTSTHTLITPVLVCVFLLTHFKHLWFKNTVQKALNECPVALSIIEKNIPEHSAVYPIDMSGHWLAIHFSNYLAANKSILVLDNYEASNNYFPIKWKQKPKFKWMLGAIDLYNLGGEQSKQTDYVLFHGTITAFQNEKNDLTSNILSYYKISMVFKNFILFEHKIEL